jgi:hypothetical protein
VQADIWQLQFHSAPAVLKDVNHDLATDENILRWQVTRSRDLPRVKQWRVLREYGKMANLDLLFERGGASSSAAGGGGRGAAQAHEQGYEDDHEALEFDDEDEYDDEEGVFADDSGEDTSRRKGSSEPGAGVMATLNVARERGGAASPPVGSDALPP